MIRISQWRKNHCNPDEQDCESHSQGIREGKLTIWVRSFETENYNRVHQTNSFSRIAYPVLMTLMSAKTNTLADGLIERISSMLDEIESKTVHGNKEGDW